MKIKKGDKVKILAGRDKGKAGKVLQVYPKHLKLAVEGVNLLYKNMRPKRQGEAGQRIQYPAPLHISNVELVCPKTNQPTRIGYKILDNHKKVRVSKKANEPID